MVHVRVRRSIVEVPVERPAIANVAIPVVAHRESLKTKLPGERSPGPP